MFSNTQIVQSPQMFHGSLDSSSQSRTWPVGVSPGKAVDRRGKSFAQLSTLKQLFEEGVLNQEEFDEHKKIILDDLGSCDLNK